MAYRRMVQYGDRLEIYEYERDLTLSQRGISRHARRNVLQGLVVDRATPLSPVETKKRRDNALRSRLVFERLVETNLVRVGRPLFASFTYADNFKDIRGAWEDFRTFIKALRCQFGKGFSYIAAPEFQKRGAVHFHALFWGLPSTVFEQERSTRLVAGIWSHGFVDITETDGSLKIAGYVGKYMSKASLDPRLCHLKAYSTSKNLQRPLSQAIGLTWPILDDYELSTTPPFHQSEYSTQWLGQCKKKIYKLK